MKWIKIEKGCELPQQGMKILCEQNGDFWVAQRFGKYWIPIPYTDSVFAKIDAPDQWAQFEFPGTLTGKMRIIFEGKSMDMDEFEKEDPEAFSYFIHNLKNLCGKTHKNPRKKK